MAQFDVNTHLYSLIEYIQQLPPHVIGITAGVKSFCLMVSCGVLLGPVLGFFSLFVFQSGFVFVETLLFSIVIFALYGLSKAIGMIKAGYAKSALN